MAASSKWQMHIECTKIIRAHRDWTNEQVLEAARMHKLDMHIVAEARREVETEAVPGSTTSQRSF